jgi:adenylate cyclase, class 2
MVKIAGTRPMATSHKIRGGGLEVEARFLNVDVEDVRRRLRENGAKMVHPMMLYRRYVFNLINKNEKGYARVRQENGNVTMTIKKYGANKFASEYEVALGDGITLEQAREFMIAAGFVQKSYHETLREKYSHPLVNEIVIDVIPGLPAYVEVESDTEDKMNQMAVLLGFDISKASYGAYGKHFEEYYGIENPDETIELLTFTHIDKNLEKLLKKSRDFLMKVKADNLKFYLSVVPGAKNLPANRSKSKSKSGSKSASKSNGSKAKNGSRSKKNA